MPLLLHRCQVFATVAKFPILTHIILSAHWWSNKMFPLFLLFHLWCLFVLHLQLFHCWGFWDVKWIHKYIGVLRILLNIFSHFHYNILRFLFRLLHPLLFSSHSVLNPRDCLHHYVLYVLYSCLFFVIIFCWLRLFLWLTNLRVLLMWMHRDMTG